jgi:hypothetical protein
LGINGGPQAIRRKGISFQWITKISSNPKPVFLKFQSPHCMGFFISFYMIQYNSDRDDKALVEIRPNVILESFNSDRENERFQNETLRPILKLQHNLLVDFILNQPKFDSVLKHKEVRKVFEDKLKDFINQAYLKGQLIGMITGHFTSFELKFYLTQSKDINKRISQMLLQRFTDAV